MKQHSFLFSNALLFLSGLIFFTGRLSAQPPTNPPAPATPFPAFMAMDVDSKWRRIPPLDHYTLVMYTNADLEQVSRDMSQALDPLRGKKRFIFMQVLDFRGSVPAIARSLVNKEVRKHMDREAARVKPFYLKNGNASNPRQDMIAFADFSGVVLNRLGWHDHYTNIRLLVFDKQGRQIKEFDKVDNPADVTAYLQTFFKN